MISSAEYREIAEAHAARRIPPWKTSLGGEIFIHGEMGERGGTAGCVAVSDRRWKSFSRRWSSALRC